MIFSIDHIVFAATAAQREELMATLAGHGFSPERFTLEFPEIGAASESLSFLGGGFVEFVAELDATRSPKVWFAETPRVIGIGFASDAFERDVGGWLQEEAWRMDEDHVLPDGMVLNIHAAGPHHHLSDFYVFVMDRQTGTLSSPAPMPARLCARSACMAARHSAGDATSLHGFNSRARTGRLRSGTRRSRSRTPHSSASAPRWCLWGLSRRI